MCGNSVIQCARWSSEWRQGPCWATPVHSDSPGGSQGVEGRARPYAHAQDALGSSWVAPAVVQGWIGKVVKPERLCRWCLSAQKLLAQVSHVKLTLFEFGGASSTLKDSWWILRAVTDCRSHTTLAGSMQALKGWNSARSGLGRAPQSLLYVLTLW